jgi:hypothetical protein
MSIQAGHTWVAAVMAAGCFNGWAAVWNVGISLANVGFFDKALLSATVGKVEVLRQVLVVFIELGGW